MNAVLRKIADNAGRIEYPRAKDDAVKIPERDVQLSGMLCRMYTDDYGAGFAERMLEYKGDNSLTCVRINLIKPVEPPPVWIRGKYAPDAIISRTPRI